MRHRPSGRYGRGPAPLECHLHVDPPPVMPDPPSVLLQLLDPYASGAALPGSAWQPYRPEPCGEWWQGTTVPSTSREVPLGGSRKKQVVAWKFPYLTLVPQRPAGRQRSSQNGPPHANPFHVPPSQTLRWRCRTGNQNWAHEVTSPPKKWHTKSAEETVGLAPNGTVPIHRSGP